MKGNKPVNVLFLGRQNACRSVIAESLLNTIGAGRFQPYSAGTEPAQRVHPLAIELLAKNKLATEHLRPKNLDRFCAPGLLELDFVISVCDLPPQALQSSWPGKPLLAHWVHADPITIGKDADQLRHGFFTTYNQLYRRLMIFASLPLDKIDGALLQDQLDEIGAD